MLCSVFVLGQSVSAATSTSKTDKEESFPITEVKQEISWSDQSKGEALVQITLKDSMRGTPNNTNTDYFIIFDRSGSMYFDYTNVDTSEYAKDSNITINNCPCVNPNHYHIAGGSKYNLITYSIGVRISDGKLNTNLAQYKLNKNGTHADHYNEKGIKISTKTGEKCESRYTIIKKHISTMVDTLLQGAKKNRIGYVGVAADTGKTLYQKVKVTEGTATSIKTAIANTKPYRASYYRHGFIDAVSQVRGRGTTTRYRNAKILLIGDGDADDMASSKTESAKFLSLDDDGYAGTTSVLSIAPAINPDDTGGSFILSLVSKNKPSKTTVSPDKYGNDKGRSNYGEVLYANSTIDKAIKAFVTDIANTGTSEPTYAKGKTLTVKFDADTWSYVGSSATYSKGSVSRTDNVLTWNLKSNDNKEDEEVTYTFSFKVQLTDKGKLVNKINQEILLHDEKNNVALTYTVKGGKKDGTDRTVSLERVGIPWSPSPVVVGGITLNGVYTSGTTNWVKNGAEFTASFQATTDYPYASYGITNLHIINSANTSQLLKYTVANNTTTPITPSVTGAITDLTKVSGTITKTNKLTASGYYKTLSLVARYKIASASKTVKIKPFASALYSNSGEASGTGSETIIKSDGTAPTFSWSQSVDLSVTKTYRVTATDSESGVKNGGITVLIKDVKNSTLYTYTSTGTNSYVDVPIAKNTSNGIINITVTATDNVGNTSTKDYTITAKQPPVVESLVIGDGSNVYKKTDGTYYVKRNSEITLTSTIVASEPYRTTLTSALNFYNSTGTTLGNTLTVTQGTTWSINGSGTGTYVNNSGNSVLNATTANFIEDNLTKTRYVNALSTSFTAANGTTVAIHPQGKAQYGTLWLTSSSLDDTKKLQLISDGVAPTITWDKALNIDSTQTYRVTATDTGSGLKTGGITVTVKGSDGNILNTYTSTATNNYCDFTIAANYGGGKVTVTVTATDNVGNIQTSSSRAGIISPPVITEFSITEKQFGTNVYATNKDRVYYVKKDTMIQLVTRSYYEDAFFGSSAVEHIVRAHYNRFTDENKVLQNQGRSHGLHSYPWDSGYGISTLSGNFIDNTATKGAFSDYVTGSDIKYSGAGINYKFTAPNATTVFVYPSALAGLISGWANPVESEAYDESVKLTLISDGEAPTITWDKPFDITSPQTYTVTATDAESGVASTGAIEVLLWADGFYKKYKSNDGESSCTFTFDEFQATSNELTVKVTVNDNVGNTKSEFKYYDTPLVTPKLEEVTLEDGNNIYKEPGTDYIFVKKDSFISIYSQSKLGMPYYQNKKSYLSFREPNATKDANMIMLQFIGSDELEEEDWYLGYNQTLNGSLIDVSSLELLFFDVTQDYNAFTYSETFSNTIGTYFTAKHGALVYVNATTVAEDNIMNSAQETWEDVLQLISDGVGPEITLDNNVDIESNIVINLKDALSGVNLDTVRVKVSNESTKEIIIDAAYDTDTVIIPIIKDNPSYQGKLNVVVTASDNVGNASTFNNTITVKTDVYIEKEITLVEQSPNHTFKHPTLPNTYFIKNDTSFGFTTTGRTLFPFAEHEVEKIKHMILPVGRDVIEQSHSLVYKNNTASTEEESFNDNHLITFKNSSVTPIKVSGYVGGLTANYVASITGLDNDMVNIYAQAFASNLASAEMDESTKLSMLIDAVGPTITYDQNDDIVNGNVSGDTKDNLVTFAAEDSGSGVKDISVTIKNDRTGDLKTWTGTNMVAVEFNVVDTFFIGVLNINVVSTDNVGNITETSYRTEGIDENVPIITNVTVSESANVYFDNFDYYVKPNTFVEITTESFLADGTSSFYTFQHVNRFTDSTQTVLNLARVNVTGHDLTTDRATIAFTASSVVDGTQSTITTWSASKYQNLLSKVNYYFTLPDGQETQMYSQAIAGTTDGKTLRSSEEFSEATKVTLISDGLAPIINVPEVLAEDFTKLEDKTKLTFTSMDTGSGIKPNGFKVEVVNKTLNKTIASYQNNGTQIKEVIDEETGDIIIEREFIPIEILLDFTNVDQQGELEFIITSTDNLGNVNVIKKGCKVVSLVTVEKVAIEQSDNVYAVSGVDNRFYVRGNSLINLSFKANTQVPLVNYQVDDMAFMVTEGFDNQNIVDEVHVKVPHNKVTTSIVSNQIANILVQTGNAYAERSNMHSETNYYADLYTKVGFTTSKVNNKEIAVYPYAKAVDESSLEFDSTKKIELIVDSYTPSVAIGVGSEILNGVVTNETVSNVIRFDAIDTGSGMKEIKATITNQDNKKTVSFTEKDSLNITIDLTNELYLGALEIELTATDNVGNILVNKYSVTTFDVGTPTINGAISIDDSSGNVYKQLGNAYFVKKDSVVRLNTSAALSEGNKYFSITSVRNHFTDDAKIVQGSVNVAINGLNGSLITEGSTSFIDISKSVLSSINVEQFTAVTSQNSYTVIANDKEQFHVYPQVVATSTVGGISLESGKLVDSKRITLISDGEAPVLKGTVIPSKSDDIFDFNFYVTDAGSGVKENSFSVEIYNKTTSSMILSETNTVVAGQLDNGIKANCGELEFRFMAMDNVGNIHSTIQHMTLNYDASKDPTREIIVKDAIMPIGEVNNVFKKEDAVNSYYVQGGSAISLYYEAYTKTPTATFRVDSAAYRVTELNTPTAVSGTITIQVPLSSNDNSITETNNADNSYLTHISAITARNTKADNGFDENLIANLQVNVLAADKKEFSVYPLASATENGNVITSIPDDDSKKVTLISDTKKPTINVSNGANIINSFVTSDSTDKVLTFNSFDDGSGMRSISVKIRNVDNGMSQTFNGTDAVSVIINPDDELYLGNLLFDVIATDNVNNKETMSFEVTCFDVESVLNRTLGDITNGSFAEFEQGVLTIKANGYVDQVDIEFVEVDVVTGDRNYVTLSNLNKTYTYTTNKETKKTQLYTFEIPEHAKSGQYLIYVTAYKKSSTGTEPVDKTAYEMTVTNAFGVNQSVLNRIRTRIR